MNIGGYPILHLLSYFMIYSFFGWCIESIYRSICEKKIINTGFLYGIVCPIYGIGAIIMILLLDGIKDNIFLLFITGFVILSIWEYIVSVLLELVFKRKYWDYSDKKFNIHGRVCLLNSIFWGILGIIFTLFIHPFIENIIIKIDYNLLLYANIIIYIAFIVDVVKSIINHKTVAKQLEKLEKISKQLRKNIIELKNSKKEQITEELKKSINDMKYEIIRLKMKLIRRAIKIKRAFPTMQSEIINKLTEQKFELGQLKSKISKLKNKKIKNNR